MLFGVVGFAGLFCWISGFSAAIWLSVGNWFDVCNLVLFGFSFWVCYVCRRVARDLVSDWWSGLLWVWALIVSSSWFMDFCGWA